MSRPHAPLTPRELEILGLIASGHSNKVIGGMLGLSARTVETHRLNLRRKTNTGTRSALVALAQTLTQEQTR